MNLKQLLLGTLSLFAVTAMAQTEEERARIAGSYDQVALTALQNRLADKNKQERTYALEQAAAQGWAITYEKGNGGIGVLQAVHEDGWPIYYETMNLQGSQTIESVDVYPGGSLNLNASGQGITLGIWDGGTVRSTHSLLNNRPVQQDDPDDLSSHATHVAGTMVGNATANGGAARGIAYSAEQLLSWDFSNDEPEFAQAAAAGLLLSNHSYGIPSANVPLYYLGKYDQNARDMDEVCYNAPYYLPSVSAGNDRNQNPLVNAGDGGYDLLTDKGVGKNVLTVAAINGFGNYVDNTTPIMSSFSSWGPTDDGRIKPDISAKGVNVLSSTATNNNSYANFNGTSMSAPMVTGGLAILQQLYNNENGQFMKSATAKALVLSTANEAGPNPGPDYQFGWGVMSVANAARAILFEDFQTDIQEVTLTNGSTDTYTYVTDGASPLVVSVVWTDLHGAGSVGSVDNQTLDEISPDIVNDLDVLVTAPDGTTQHFPWKLDPANPAAAATRNSVNDVDNVEIVTVDNPMPGTYTVTISHKGTLVTGSQDYSIVVSGTNLGDYAITADEVNQVSCGDTATFNLNYYEQVNFADTVTLTTSGLPAGVNASFTNSSFTQDGSSVLTITGLNSIAAGTYTFDLTASSASAGNDVRQLTVRSFGNATLGQVQNIFPADNDTGISVVPVITWDADPFAQRYNIQFASNASFGFGSVFADEIVTTNSYSLGSQPEQQDIFWRVRPINDCSQGPFVTAQFRTGTLTCNPTIVSTDTPVNIPTVPNPTPLTASLTIPASQSVNYSVVKVHVDISHTWVGDMTISLQSPQGQRVKLIQSPTCGEGDDIDAIFDDLGAAVNCVAGVAPTLSGTVRPQESLAQFANRNSAGTWTLVVEDPFNNDGGSINGFELEFCTTPTVGLEDESLAAFTVYPNPADDYVMISLDDSTVSDATMSIVDIQGRVILSQKLDSRNGINERINTSEMSAGVYFVRIDAGNASNVQKLVVR